VISRTAGYALNAVIHIARRAGDQGAVPAAAAARELGVPANYLSKILRDLAHAGVLVSDRGRKGGFRLARPASEIRLLEVVEPFDGLDERRQCLLGRGACSDVGGCPAHREWKEASAPMVRFFESRTVAEMLGPGSR
jgi:Rrf2 family protein